MEESNSNPIWARRIGKFLFGRIDVENGGKWTIKNRPICWALMDYTPDDDTSGIALIAGGRQYSIFWPRKTK